jgi:2-dehydro-3-deoxy-D-arabinonate dehydratase
VTAVWRIDGGAGPRLATGPAGDGPQVLLPARVRVADLLAPGGWAGLSELAAGGEPVPAGHRVLAPLDEQNVWAAGVTYRRSRDARLAESGQLDAYDKVYVAQRPELFWKAGPHEARGPGETVGIRADSTWDVPEPELAVVADATGRIVAATIGNDVSSRSIEGENPLYLPQAKTYRHSLGLGPALVGWEDLADLMAGSVGMTIHRAGAVVVEGAVQLSEMQREPAELVRWLLRARDFPHGVVLLTGTGIVPDPGFTLAAGDEVRITVTGLGELVNTVEVVGDEAASSEGDG